jgi:hypothetical protein
VIPVRPCRAGGYVVDLAGSWPAIVRWAGGRHRQKVGYGSTRLLSDDPHLDGCAGEWAFSMLTGLDLDMGLDACGDDGTDFWCPYGAGFSVQVKTSKYVADPWLRLFADEALRADCYVLVGLDRDARRAWVCGWASRREVAAAPVVVVPGRGGRRVLRQRELRDVDGLLTKMKV